MITKQKDLILLILGEFLDIGMKSSEKILDF